MLFALKNRTQCQPPLLVPRPTPTSTPCCTIYSQAYKLSTLRGVFAWAATMALLRYTLERSSQASDH